MNASNQIRNLINLNLASFIRRTIVTDGLKIRSSTISPALVNATDFNKYVSLKSESQSKCSFENTNSINKIVTLFMQDSLVKTQITDPKISEKLNIGIPINILLIKDFKLPSLNEKSVVEPVGNVIEKQALNIFQIRSKKIRKHKKKKVKRKMRTFFVNKKERKKAKQNKELLAFITKALEEGEKFDVEAQIDEILEKVKWKPPVTRVRGRLAPEWVIEEYTKKNKLKQLLNQRIEECSKRL